MSSASVGEIVCVCVRERERDDVRLSLLDVKNFNSIEARRARDASLRRKK